MTKKKKKDKYGLASGKTTGKPRAPRAEEEGTMLVWLRQEIYAYTYPFDNLDSKGEKDTCAMELADILRKDYKNFRIINTLNLEYTPKDRIWLNYPICITREKVGIPIFHFLTYAKGGNFVKQCDAVAISDKAGIEPDQIKEVCKYFANYLRGEICEKHKHQHRDPRVRPGNGASTVYNIGTVNFNNY